MLPISATPNHCSGKSVGRRCRIFSIEAPKQKPSTGMCLSGVHKRLLCASPLQERSRSSKARKVAPAAEGGKACGTEGRGGCGRARRRGGGGSSGCPSLAPTLEAAEDFAEAALTQPLDVEVGKPDAAARFSAPMRTTAVR